ncbi:MAG: inositol monophosphatase [Clostridia bacterium]|nr:inositol monophosphatase [Clostridia bacterium]
MQYEKELSFIKARMATAYEKFGGEERKIEQKRAFDLVTDLDKNIERFLTAEIKKGFPFDKVLGEEFSSSETLVGRTWVLDPIDGTCNMANGLKFFGLQAALLDGAEILLSVVYLPHFDEWYYAVKGEGAWCNGERIWVNDGVELQNALVSIGDYPHRNTEMARIEHEAIRNIFPKVGKMRMFGGSCMDFAFTAAGKTHACISITHNVWDIAPGLLLCKEAGAKVCNLQGKPYVFGDDGVIAAANEEVFALVKNSFIEASLNE